MRIISHKTIDVCEIQAYISNHRKRERPAPQIGDRDMNIVKDEKGAEIRFDAAMNLADNEICEKMNNDFPAGWEDKQAYIEEYARRHEEQFGEEFAPFVGGAW